MNLAAIFSFRECCHLSAHVGGQGAHVVELRSRFGMILLTRNSNGREPRKRPTHPFATLLQLPRCSNFPSVASGHFGAVPKAELVLLKMFRYAPLTHHSPRDRCVHPWQMKHEFGFPRTCPRNGC